MQHPAFAKSSSGLVVDLDSASQQHCLCDGCGLGIEPVGYQLFGPTS